MTRVALSILCLSLLAACASEPLPPVGVSAQDTGPSQAHVAFRGFNGMRQSVVSDSVLLAAAELAVNDGYDWLQVTHRSMEMAPPVAPQVSTNFKGATDSGSYANQQLSDYQAHLAKLDVQFGHGAPPAGADIYVAKAVVRDLGPKVLAAQHEARDRLQ